MRAILITVLRQEKAKTKRGGAGTVEEARSMLALIYTSGRVGLSVDRPTNYLRFGDSEGRLSCVALVRQ